MVSSTDLLNSAMDLLSHPARTQRVMGNLITKIYGGEAIIFNAGSPASNVLEAASTITAAAIDEMRTLDRKRYAIASVSSADVLRHVADEDVIGIYSTPSRGTFRFAFDVNALTNAAVNESADGQVKKIVIPRHSTVTNGVHEFTFQYPLIIRIYPNQGIQCLWDVSKTSPIEYVKSTHVESRIAYNANNGLRHLIFDVDLPQLSLMSRENNVNSTTGFLQTYGIPAGQSFHYCRVFIRNDGESIWREIITRYGHEVYDPAKPSATVRVLDAGVEVRVPLVYLVNNMINNSIRVDIYTTYGPLDYLMSGFNENAFNVRWNDYDVSANESVFVAALDRLNGRSLFGLGSVMGGKAGVSTAQLRDQFINRSQYTQGFAITRDQVANAVGAYGLVNGIDDLTDRQFLATRQLPNYIEGYGLDQSSMKTATGLGMTIGLMQFNLASLSTSKYISDHGNRITIHPKCLFKRVEGKLQLVDDTVIATLQDRNQTTLEELVTTVNTSEFLFTPYHHRLDVSGSRIQIGAYHLTEPTVVSKHALQFNVDSAIAASTRGYAVGYREQGDGYTIGVDLVPDAVMVALGASNVNLQLSFIGEQGGPRNFINGTLMNDLNSSGEVVGDAWIYHFHLKSTMDINRAHQLIVHDDDVAMALEKAFDLTIVVRNYVPANVDYNLMAEYYDQRKFENYDAVSTYMAITRERLTVKFGVHLSHLWTRCRNVPEETQYQIYDEVVYKVWERDQYKLDSLGLPELHWNGTTGKYEKTILHHAGEDILDVNGLPEPRFNKGEVVKDEYGMPVPVDGNRGIVRQVEMLLVDGRYFFTNEELTLNYLTAAVDQLSKWIVNDIPTYEKRVLNAERSDLLFYPTDTMGKVRVTADGGSQVDLPTTQYVGVDVYMSDEKYSSVELKDEITSSIPIVVNSALNKTTVSIQDVEKSIREALGDSAISVRISGLFDDRFNTVTINDHTGAFCLDKRLEIQTNLSLAVVDNIDVRFHRHAATV